VLCLSEVAFLGNVKLVNLHRTIFWAGRKCPASCDNRADQRRMPHRLLSQAIPPTLVLARRSTRRWGSGLANQHEDKRQCGSDKTRQWLGHFADAIDVGCIKYLGD
jgi:hypothetical protein